MDEKLWEKAQELAKRNYTVSVLVEEDSFHHKYYLAKTLELYGCMAEGATPEEAINNIYDARVDYIYSLLEDGLEVPEPSYPLTSANGVDVDTKDFKFNINPNIAQSPATIVQSSTPNGYQARIKQISFSDK